MNKPQKFRKLPVVIEAFQWNAPEDAYVIVDWADDHDAQMDYEEDGAGPLDPDGEDWGHLVVETLEGRMTVSPHDYVIRGVEGEFYPCRQDIFERTYEFAG